VRKLASLLIICCLTLPAVGLYFFLNAEINSIKKSNQQLAVEKQIDENHIVITMSNQDIDKMIDWENDHEFEWNRRMFDVKKQEKKADSIIFWCRLDVEETLINEQLDKLFGFLTGARSNQSETQHLLEKIFKKLYCPFEENIPVRVLAAKSEHRAMTPTHWESLSQTISTPPPDDKLI